MLFFFFLHLKSIENKLYSTNNCTVCLDSTGVGSNSIFCNSCKQWVHKKCSGHKCLTKDPEYRCTQSQGTACPLDGRPQTEVQIKPDKLEVVASFCYLGDMLSAASCQLEVVASFCYLGDMLSAASGCELPTTKCVKTT